MKHFQKHVQIQKHRPSYPYQFSRLRKQLGVITHEHTRKPGAKPQPYVWLQGCRKPRKTVSSEYVRSSSLEEKCWLSRNEDENWCVRLKGHRREVQCYCGPDRWSNWLWKVHTRRCSHPTQDAEQLRRGGVSKTQPACARVSLLFSRGTERSGCDFCLFQMLWWSHSAFS